MGVDPIPFGNDQQSGDHQLAGASPLAINVLTDGRGAVRRRPGIAKWAGFPDLTPSMAPVIGIHAFERDIYYVLGNRRIYKIDPSAAIGTFMGLLLDGEERPTFAVTRFRLVITGGGLPVQVESGATAATLLGGAPPESSQVIALASRLFTNDLTDASTSGNVRFSRTGNSGEQYWDPLDFTGSEARPDPVLAMRENANEAFVWGTSTLQIFSPDASLILAPGRAQNRGISAPASIIAKNDTFAWLDEQREFVVSDGRSVEVVSDALAGVIDDIPDVSDCFGFWLNIDQFSALCWCFPTDGRTFAVQEKSGWSQFQGWDDGIGYAPFPVTAHYYWPDQNLHLVGFDNGRIGVFDPFVNFDNRNPGKNPEEDVLYARRIKAEVRTGFLSRGTDAPKSCDIVRLTFKRGQAAAAAAPAPEVLLSWRDDLGPFSDPVRLSLGVVGDYNPTIELRGLGVYRARQWQLEFGDSAVDFVLARAEEVWSAGGNS